MFVIRRVTAVINCVLIVAIWWLVLWHSWPLLKTWQDAAIVFGVLGLLTISHLAMTFSDFASERRQFHEDHADRFRGLPGGIEQKETHESDALRAKWVELVLVLVACITVIGLIVFRISF